MTQNLCVDGNVISDAVSNVCVDGTPVTHVCADGTVVYDIPVAGNTIVANNDATTGQAGDDEALWVIVNDTLNGNPVVPGTVTITATTAVPPELDFHADGYVDILPGAADGVYTFDYQICENANPANCDTATVTITVTSVPVPVMNAVNDTEIDVDGNAGDANVLNVFDNDTIDGNPANAGNSQLGVITAVPPELTFDTATGVVGVPAGTPAGTYTFDYQLCEAGSGFSNCDTATVSVTVVAAAPNEFITSYPTRVEDIRPLAGDDANATIHLGNLDSYFPDAIQNPAVGNRGIDTLVNRAGAGPDKYLTSSGIANPVGAYIGEVSNPTDVVGVSIDFGTAAGLDLDSFTPLPAGPFNAVPPPGTAKGIYFWQSDAAGNFSAYTPGTIVDVSTIGGAAAIFGGAFADAGVANAAGHQYTLNATYNIHYANGDVLSVPYVAVATSKSAGGPGGGGGPTP